jgi:hypothetical protein
MIITESQLRNDTKQKRNSVLNEQYVGQMLSSEPYIFISHKHSEEEYVYRLRDILKRYGFAGYVDWEDDDMPPTTSADTAKKLKSKIKQSNKFILIATQSAIESKWCNWEVGFADAHKFVHHIALFPVKGDFGNYKGEEYLQIYTSLQVKRKKDKRGFGYYVHYPSGKDIPLQTWLTI